MQMNANDVVLHMQISHASVLLPFCVKESHLFVDVVYSFIFAGPLLIVGKKSISTRLLV